MGRRTHRNAAPGSWLSPGTYCSTGRASRCHLLVMPALAAIHELRHERSVDDADHIFIIADIAAMVAMSENRGAIVDMASLACMAIKIDLLSREPSYLQLAAILRARIESRKIPPEGALPSITFLVQETGLAVGTVRKAIKVLADEGLVVTVPGRGSFVIRKT